jgi:5'-3' exonuclease
MLLDAASLYFRAYYGVPESITAPDGTPVNAVRGFCDMVSRLLTERRPGRLVACLDLDWRPSFRVAALPSYKAHRVAGAPDTAPEGVAEVVPDGLAPQVPVILEVLAAAGLATAGAEGYEADDVIGTLCARETADPVAVVSGDRDLMQVVRDVPTPVRLVYVGRGLAKAETLGPPEVAAKYGVPAARAGAAYAEMAMLRGDPSDGLPGVPGIGAKTAATLVGRFGSWDELRAAVADRGDTRLSPPVRSKLDAAAPYLAVVEPVVRVAVDAAVRVDGPDRVPAAPVDPDRLADLARRWALGGTAERLVAALAAAGTPEQGTREQGTPGQVGRPTS